LHLYFLTSVYSFISSKIIVPSNGFHIACIQSLSPLWLCFCIQMLIKEMKVFPHCL
jgi:hypothetical protein